MLTPAQLRRNAVLHILDGVFFMIALAIFSFEAIIPPMIEELTSSALALGMVRLVAGSCVLLPQVFFVKRVEGLPYKKRVILLLAIVQRLGWIIFFISLFIRWSPGFTLSIFYASLAVGSLGGGMIVPLWSDWYAKTTPESSWGWIMGVRWAVPGIFIAAMGPWIKRVLAEYPAPQRYQVLLGVALGFYAISYLTACMIKEERDESQQHQRHTPWSEYFQGLGWIVFRRRDFRRFLLGSVLLVGPMLVVMTFMTRYALASGVPRPQAGTFNSYYHGSLAAGALFAGIVSDRHGAVMPYRFFPLALVTACFALPAAAARPALFVPLFCLTGFSFGTWAAAQMPAVMKFAGPHRRPSYTAVSFTIITLANSLAPVLSGLLLDAGWLGYSVLFPACGVVALAGWTVVFGLRPPQPHGT
jgi:MFS family permease